LRRVQRTDYGFKMKPRFATGVGTAPVYLADISFGKSGRGVLVFTGGNVGARKVPFHSDGDLHAKLSILIRQNVPLSVGGHAVGPADRVAMLIESGKLNGPYIDISWSRPEHWTVRERVKGAVEWQPVARADTFASINFDPDSIDAGK